MNLRVPCLILLLFAIGAHAQMPPPEAPAMSAEEVAQMQAAQEARQAWHARMAGQLAASGQARELALAATLLQGATRDPVSDADGQGVAQSVPRDPRVGQWRRLASARAGSDVLANMLLMQADPDAAGGMQVRAEAIERWRKLEPGNLAPLLYASPDIDPVLADARLMDRFDLHWYEQARWMQSAFLAHPPTAAERAAIAQSAQAVISDGFPPDEVAAMESMGILLAVALPGRSSLTEACRGEALASSATRRDDCRHLGQVMADASDTNLGMAIGTALLLQTAQTAHERALAQARQRRNDWQMQQWGRLSGAQPKETTRQVVRLLRDPAIRTEQDAVRQSLEHAGVPLDPPAGWQSPWR